MLSARAIAVEGVGYEPAVLARAGLWDVGSGPEPTVSYSGPWRRLDPRKLRAPDLVLPLVPVPLPAPAPVVLAPLDPLPEVIRIPDAIAFIQADAVYRDQILGALSGPVPAGVPSIDAAIARQKAAQKKAREQLLLGIALALLD